MPLLSRLRLEDGNYSHSDINWDEFWNVVGGHGQGNVDRLTARVKAWDDGAWVRDAAVAYSKKHQQVNKRVA